MSFLLFGFQCILILTEVRYEKREI